MHLPVADIYSHFNSWINCRLTAIAVRRRSHGGIIEA